MAESLGPKPTAKQMETLRLLCEEGAEIHWWSGIRTTDSARIVIGASKTSTGRRIKLRTDTMYKFYDWGWIESFGDPAWKWRNNEYRITEKGRKVVELGVIRK